MAPVTIVVLVVGAAVTVLLLGFVLLVQAQRITRAYGEATRVVERVQPVLATLAEQQQVTSRELARISQDVDALRASRAARRAR